MLASAVSPCKPTRPFAVARTLNTGTSVVGASESTSDGSKTGTGPGAGADAGAGAGMGTATGTVPGAGVGAGPGMLLQGLTVREAPDPQRAAPITSVGGECSNESDASLAAIRFKDQVK